MIGVISLVGMLLILVMGIKINVILVMGTNELSYLTKLPHHWNLVPVGTSPDEPHITE